MEVKNKLNVLVTGASGFISSHLIKLLLERDYKVRGTVRSLANKNKYEFLYDLVPEKKDNLDLVEADLCEKLCWPAAVEGCEFVFHVASPIPPYIPKDDMEIIGPAIFGTRNVLEAAISKGIKKVVLTSSSHSISAGNEAKILTEDDWADESKCGAYAKSKLLAEKIAWELYDQNKGKIDLTVINPSLTLGPIFTKHGNSSETLIADIMKGAFPGIMDVKVGLVDVRDVAEAHYKAMFNEGTNGKRYICSGQGISFEEIIKLLKLEFEKYAYNIIDKKVTAEEVMENGNPVAQRQIGMIGKEIKFNNERSLKDLNMKYRPYEETIIDMGYSLIKQGVIPDYIKLNKKKAMI